MSDMGVIGTNLYLASKLLGRYDLALEAIRSRGGSADRPDEVKSLVAVLAPLSRHLRGMAYYALGVNAEEMSKFLRLRHREDWPSTRDGILSVASRLEKGGGKADLSGVDLPILSDVSDALDSECSSLFRAMRGRRALRTWGC